MRPLSAVILAIFASWTLSGQTYAISTFAGNGTMGFSGDNGPATSAELNDPYGVALDSSGDLYIADSGNNCIRKVTNGVITTVAGNGTQGFSGDNFSALGAELNFPNGVAVDLNGNMYIADTDNNRIRKVAGGIITTVAGNGTKGFSGDNGPATSAELCNPYGVAVDAAGNLYVADTCNSRIRKISGGIITTVAGNGTQGFRGDGGSPLTAEFAQPSGIAVDSNGNLHIADQGNNRIREVTLAAGIITTVAGNGDYPGGFSGDGGPATSAKLYGPHGIAVDPAGNLFIADTGNERVRRVSNGIITTIAGNGNLHSSGVNGLATSTSVGEPLGVVVDSAGNLYIADNFNSRVLFLTPVATPIINQNGIVPIYSSVPVIQAGSWVSIYGTNLASGTLLWNSNFPTALGGTSVTINNKPAYLWSVSPLQINLQAPDDTATGTVSVVVTTSFGTATSTVTLALQAPSFSLLGDGKHVAGEIATPNGTGAYGGGTYDLVGPSGAFSFNTRPVKAGETLLLFGVGFGPTTPPVPAGQVFSGAAPTNYPVTVTIGGVNANVAFAGMTQAGLYQFNLTVPNAHVGDQPLQAIINGVQTPLGAVVTIQ